MKHALDMLFLVIFEAPKPPIGAFFFHLKNMSSIKINYSILMEMIWNVIVMQTLFLRWCITQTIFVYISKDMNKDNLLSSAFWSFTFGYIY